MIYFLKKYWKYIVCVLVVLTVGFISYFCYEKNSEVSTSSVKKLSVVKEENKQVNTLFVDIKGAVNAPGVYELDSNKRVIDVINLAGGLKDEADTINLNLSKKLKDEMYIVVYTKDEIYNYKKRNENTNEISCASFECVCPDIKNDACIKESSSTTYDTKKQSDKVSINTASKEELMKLPGIGDAKADSIISFRQKNGKFNSTEDIKNVSGIGDSVYEKIKDYIIL